MSKAKLSLVKALMDGIQEMVYIVRVEEDAYYCEFLNRAVMEKLDLSENAIGKTFREFNDEDISNCIELQFNQVLKSKKIVVFENIFTVNTGEQIYGETTLTPILNSEGLCTHLVGITKDITNVKIAQAEYQSLFDYNADAIFTVDLNGHILGGNFTVEQMSGYSMEELIGVNFIEYVDPADRESARECFRLSLEGTYKDYRLNFLDKTGEKVGCLIKLTPIKLKNEITGVFAVLKDMRELDKLVGKYIESQKSFQIIAENVQDVVILMNKGKEYLYVSPSSKEVFGFNNESIGEKTAFFNIHSDDIEVLEQQFNQSVLDGKSYTVHLKAKHKERGWIWTEINGNPVFDEQKNFQHMLMIARDITLQKEKEEQLQYFAYHDSLTGLPNRRYFKVRLSRAIELQEEKGDRFAVILFDIDDFKKINDSYGHEVGDYVIQEFSERLKSTFREEDVVARLGGDEFIALLTKAEKEEDIILTVNKIHQVMEAPWLIQKTDIKITTSIGVAYSTTSGAIATSIVRTADEAMYEVKRAGKNLYRIIRS
jgi:diguanylate cyclase (GGDEF)-like protein/PAS domain S-box-containing protein